ncbi:spore coat protein U domain-containing protein [Phytobacter diazotrophicus]|jgi:spore coat protein U-like protein|uniref:spore coat protein U domain-containing protein n=1 Tax=Phytobacter TaxID=447792 RepID=UPI0023314D1A|nr:spore coat protein U domain-containing protein [Phytobacter diazotrophicus]MDC0727556.1 spore coat protein U domain-containing protein [Phytobacter diazotrophicus]MDC0734906.1 spore coat protein U domain-containing protein [Phytobacter diazotrophicus]
MKKIRLILLTGLVTLSVNNADAVTSNGIIGATLTLSNGCLINGSPSQSGINFGTLDFGTNPATFSQLTTQLSNTGAGGSSFTIQCTTTSYTVQITGNTNTATPGTTVGTPGTVARYLRSATPTNTQGVAYSVFSDSAFSNEIVNGAAIPRTTTSGGVDSYTLYGRITGGGNSVTVLPGTYTDTLNVSVTY